jgi:hypothetical protein
VKDVAEREARLSEIIRNPSQYMEQLRNDIRSGVIDGGHGDIEGTIYRISQMTVKQRDDYIHEGRIRISSIKDPQERQKAIAEFETWKRLAMKFNQAD